jgi:hypothetical protein
MSLSEHTLIDIKYLKPEKKIKVYLSFVDLVTTSIGLDILT